MTRSAREEQINMANQPAPLAPSQQDVMPVRADHRVTEAEEATLKSIAFHVWTFGCLAILCLTFLVFTFVPFLNWFSASFTLVLAEILCVIFVYKTLPKFRMAVPEKSAGTGFDPWHKTFNYFSWCDPSDPYVGQLEYAPGNHWRPWQLERDILIDMVPYNINVQRTIPVKGGSEFMFEGYCEIMPWPGQMPHYNACNEVVVNNGVTALYIGLMLEFTKQFDPIQLVARINQSNDAVKLGFEQSRTSGTLSIEHRYGIILREIQITNAQIDKRLRDAVAGRIEAKQIALSAKSYAKVDPEAVRLALATSDQMKLTRNEQATTFSLKIEGDGLKHLEQIAPALAALAPAAERFLSNQPKTGGQQQQGGGGGKRKRRKAGQNQTGGSNP